MTHAIRIHETGGPEVLRWIEVDVPPPGKGKKKGPKITKIAQLAGHKVGVVGRTQANVNLLKVILQQYGVDPAKVEIVQFPANEAAEMIRGQKADAYLAAGPVNSDPSAAL